LYSGQNSDLEPLEYEGLNYNYHGWEILNRMENERILREGK
jgi:hypothetical protein